MSQFTPMQGSGAALEPVLKFWPRQFAPRPTYLQHAFDVVFGMALPVFCLLADPIVFTSGGIGGGLQAVRYPCYATIATAIIALALWLLFGRWLKAVGPVFAGVLLASSLFALGIGMALLPLSVIGLMVAIGALGFTPFLTAFVFLRNGVRASRLSRRPSSGLARTAIVIVVAVLTLGVPFGGGATISMRVEKAADLIVTGTPEQIRQAEEEIRRWRWLSDGNVLIPRYTNENDPLRKQALERAYKDLTGKDIEMEIQRLSD